MELSDKSSIVKAQATHKDCADLIKSNYKEIDYEKIGETRNKKCYNRASRGETLIGLYSPNSLVTYEENGRTYCFTPEDICKIIKNKPYINPYTGKNITFNLEQKKQIYKQLNSVNKTLDIDLIQLNENRLCPLFFSQHRDIGFIVLSHSNKSITLAELSKKLDYVNISMHLSPINTRQGLAGLGETPDIEGPLDIYRVNLNGKLLDNVRPLERMLVNVDDITKISRVYNSINDDVDKSFKLTGEKKIFLSKNLVSKISKLISFGENLLTEEDLRELRNNKIVENKYFILCKGINLGNKDVKIGDEITINFKNITIWGTNLCTELAGAMKHKYGAVIMARVFPSEILFDLRYVINLDVPKIILDSCTVEVKIYFITEGKLFSNVRNPPGGCPLNKNFSREVPDIYDNTMVAIKAMMT